MKRNEITVDQIKDFNDRVETINIYICVLCMCMRMLQCVACLEHWMLFRDFASNHST